MQEVVLLLLIIWVDPVSGATGIDARALSEQLFVTDGYDKHVKPAYDQLYITDVNVTFYLRSISKLDEVAETLKTTGYLVITWYDDFLTWNESDFGALTYYLFPQDEIWKPDITLQNSVVTYKPLGNPTLYIYVDSWGNVWWYPFEVFQSSCSIDITFFPFDEQICKLTFVAWSYTKDEVYLNAASGGIDLSEFETNSEWNIVHTSAVVSEESYESAVTFSLTMKRKSRYMVTFVILPIVMLFTLNIMVFVLPCESGEKASYAVTVFLAFVVFLTIVNSTLPTNSETLSLFAVFMIILTGQSTMITILAMVLVRVSHLESPIPKALIWFVGIVNCAACRRRLKKIAPSTAPSVETLSTLDSCDRLSVKAFDDSGASDNTTEDNVEKCTWKQVASALDRLLLILFATVTIVSSVGLLIYAMAVTRK